MNEKIDILLSRYFSGEATQQELQQLDRWLSESAENEAYFDDMTMLYQQAAFTGTPPKFDTKNALEDFKAYMNKGNQLPVKKKTLRLHTYISTAAAVVILLIGMFTFFFVKDNAKLIQVASADTVLEYVIYEDIQVSLSPESEIEYSSEDKNTVRLKGEATFAVEGDEKQKFVVRAGETFIRHIGTVFTVSAFENDHMVTVEVQEGEVSFYTESNQGIIVREGQIAIYNSLTKEFQFFSFSQNSDKELKFNSLSLNEVVKMLETYYNISITFGSADLQNLLITVSFAPSEPVENVLDIIAETLSLNLISDGNSFVLSH